AWPMSGGSVWSSGTPPRLLATDRTRVGGPTAPGTGLDAHGLLDDRHAAEVRALEQELTHGLVVVLVRRRGQLVHVAVDLGFDPLGHLARRPEDPRMIGPLGQLIVVEELLVQPLARSEAGD